MRLAESLVKRLNAHLGAPGQPYQVFEQGRFVETDCIAWPLPWSDAPLGAYAEYYPLMMKTVAIFEEAGLGDALAQAVSGRKDLLYEEWRAIRNRVVEGSDRREELEALLGRMDALTARCPVTMEEGRPVFDPECLLPGEPRQRVHPGLWQVRELLEGEAAFAYLAESGVTRASEADPPEQFSLQWAATGLDCVMGDLVVVVPAADQYEALRVEQTNAANYGLDTEDVIAKLMVLDARFGIDIVAACFDGVDFLLKRTPVGDDGRKLGEWLLDFCPDLYEAPTRFDRAPIILWWD